jgi:5-deoxy-5-amino-3-dehydroquinate synthase
LKAQIVAADERDVGHLRILLNYGHTVAYALESTTGYSLPHGEAVAIGKVVEARLSRIVGLSSPDLETRQRELLARFGLPTRLPPVDVGMLIAHMQRDKKVFGNAPRWILPSGPYRATVSAAVSESQLRQALDECLASG